MKGDMWAAALFGIGFGANFMAGCLIPEKWKVPIFYLMSLFFFGLLAYVLAP